MATGLVGCEPTHQTLEEFRDVWQRAANRGDTATLYGCLDSASQQHVRAELDVIRGLDEGSQMAVVAKLGGQVREFRTMNPREYFGLLWRAVIQDQSLSVEAVQDGPESGVLVVIPLASRQMDPNGGTGRTDQPLRLLVAREGGHWRWALPREKL